MVGSICLTKLNDTDVYILFFLLLHGKDCYDICDYNNVPINKGCEDCGPG